MNSWFLVYRNGRCYRARCELEKIVMPKEHNNVSEMV